MEKRSILKNRWSQNMKRIVTFLLAFAMVVTSIVIPQASEVEAKSKKPEFYINFRIDGKVGEYGKHKMTMYAGEEASFVFNKKVKNKHTDVSMHAEKMGPQYIEFYDLMAAGKYWSFSPMTITLGKWVIGDFTYTSSNNSVATVTEKGVVQAKDKGTCTITAALTYNPKIKGTIKLTVKKETPKITLEKKKETIAAGKSTKVVIKSMKGISSDQVTYTSSDKKVAAVDSKGKVKAKKAGTATITVKSVMNSKAAAKFKVTVKNPDTIHTKYTSKGKKKIVLEKTSVVLVPEQNYSPRKLMKDANAGNYASYAETIEAELKGSGKYDICGTGYLKGMLASRKKYASAQIRVKSITGLKSKEVTYKSSNKRVAEVSKLGKVTPKKAGTATITVTSKADKKVKATYTVTVKNAVTAVRFYEITNLKKAELNMEYETPDYDDWVGVVDDRDVYPKKVKNKKLILTSSDENVVKVRQGTYGDWNIVGIKYGTATLTVKSVDGFYKYSWKVTVSDKPSRTSSLLNDGAF